MQSLVNLFFPFALNFILSQFQIRIYESIRDSYISKTRAQRRGSTLMVHGPSSFWPQWPLASNYTSSYFSATHNLAFKTISKLRNWSYWKRGSQLSDLFHHLHACFRRTLFCVHWFTYLPLLFYCMALTANPCSHQNQQWDSLSLSSNDTFFKIIFVSRAFLQ